MYPIILVGRKLADVVSSLRLCGVSRQMLYPFTVVCGKQADTVSTLTLMWCKHVGTILITLWRLIYVEAYISFLGAWKMGLAY